MRTPRTHSPPAIRLWLDWNETMLHALLTIALRSTLFASSYWMRGILPAGETVRMIGEKQLAAIEALAAGWMALPRMHGHIDHVRVAAATLGPYRRRARANSRRLSRHR
jgi:hypothetical protein